MCSCAILSMLSRFVLMLRTSWLGSPTSAIRVRLDYLISHNPPKTESCTQPFSGRTRVEIVTAHDWLAATLSTSRLQRATSRCQLAYPVARDPQLFAEKKFRARPMVRTHAVCARAVRPRASEAPIHQNFLSPLLFPSRSLRPSHPTPSRQPADTSRQNGQGSAPNRSGRWPEPRSRTLIPSPFANTSSPPYTRAGASRTHIHTMSICGLTSWRISAFLAG